MAAVIALYSCPLAIRLWRNKGKMVMPIRMSIQGTVNQREDLGFAIKHLLTLVSSVMCYSITGSIVNTCYTKAITCVIGDVRDLSCVWRGVSNTGADQ